MLWLVTPSSKGARVVEASHQPTTRGSTGTHSMHVFSLVAGLCCHAASPPKPAHQTAAVRKQSTSPSGLPQFGWTEAASKRNTARRSHYYGELWSTPKHESEPRLIPRQTQIEAGTSCS